MPYSEEDKIKYADIIQPDDSLTKLIDQLGQVQDSISKLGGVITDSAAKTLKAIKAVTGATGEGEQAILEAAAATAKLEAAQKSLISAESEVGKRIAWLKAQTAEANKETVEHQRLVASAETSYNRLKAELKDTERLYKSLTEAERKDKDMGGEVLAIIHGLKNAIKALDAEMRPHVQTVKAAKNEKTKLQQAEERLAQATSKENEELRVYSVRINQANRVAKLQAQLANSTAGSYSHLAAQYELNKIKINEMSMAQRLNDPAAKKFIENTRLIYEQMVQMQEATGNYRLSVGKYNQLFSGLGFSISQVVRELPAAAINMNTLFLAISNNIPMVVDEIKKLRIQNKALAAEGKQTISVGKTILSTIFSWNTALVLVLAAFSKYGDEIIAWGKKMLNIRDSLLSMEKALKNVRKELASSSGGYGKQIVNLRLLQEQYKQLNTEQQKTQFIMANKDAFEQMGIAINGVIEADKLFNEGSEDVIKSLQARAKAMAASSLAAKAYEAVLEKQIAEEELLAKKQSMESGPDFEAYQAKRARMAEIEATNPYFTSDWEWNKLQGQTDAFHTEYQSVLTQLGLASDNVKIAQENADKYIKIIQDLNSEADKYLSDSGLDKFTAAFSDYTKRIQEYERQLNTAITADEKATTEAVLDDFEKRTSAAHDSFSKRVRDARVALKKAAEDEQALRNLLASNEVYDPKTKKTISLTDDQKAQIQTGLDNIQKMREHYAHMEVEAQKVLNEELRQIELDRQISTLKIMQQTSSLKQQAVEKNSIDELNLRKEAIEQERQIALLENEKLVESQRQAEADINAAYDKKLLKANTDYWTKRLQQNESLSKTEFAAKVHTAEAIKDFELNLEKDTIEEKIRLNDAGIIELTADELSLLQARLKEIALLIKQNKDNLTLFDKEQTLQELQETLNDIKWQISNYYAGYKEQRLHALELEKADLERQKLRIEKQLTLFEEGLLALDDTDLENLQAELDLVNEKIKKNNQDVEKTNSLLESIRNRGFTNGILEQLGFDQQGMNAYQTATSMIVDNLNSIAQAYVDLAQAAVNAANAQVNAAQAALDAEIEARNNGYANNVEQAKRDLELEKANQKKKQKLLKEAQEQQERLQTLTQISSLVTASAEIWASMSPLGVAGPALAAAAIAAMFISFIAAKAKAREVAAAQASEEYGEGGLEMLEGGSHASGNDIDLGVNNHKKRRMRAEGGEAMAIINKRQTRHYKRLLPSLIDSLNKGTFESRFLDSMSINPHLLMQVGAGVNLSQLEGDVAAIKKASETRYYALADGSMVIIKGNNKQIIRRS